MCPGATALPRDHHAKLKALQQRLIFQVGDLRLHTLTQVALKEWAVVIQALSEGRQIVLLRKGGLADKNGLFQLRGKEFFLYPTYEHQNQSFIQPRFAKEYAAILADREERERVELGFYATVEDVAEVSDLNKLLSLREYHIWSDDFVRQRFQWKEGTRMQVLTLRVRRLPRPHVIAVEPAYRGCKSWVDLKVELSADGAQPVLPEDAYRSKAEEIRKILGSA